MAKRKPRKIEPMDYIEEQVATARDLREKLKEELGAIMPPPPAKTAEELNDLPDFPEEWSTAAGDWDVTTPAGPEPPRPSALDAPEEIVNIAKTCHEVNRAYCAGMGDNSQPSWEDAPEWQRVSAVSGVRAHIERITNNLPPDPSWSHRQWLKAKARDGWRYGPVEDADKREHPFFLDFDALSKAQQMKDVLFESVVRGLYS